MKPLFGNAELEARDLYTQIEGLVDKIGLGDPDSRTIVPGRSGTLKVFDLVYIGNIFNDVLAGKRNTQELREIRNTLSGQASKVGTGSVSRLDTATLGFGSTPGGVTSTVPLVEGGILRDTHADLGAPGTTTEIPYPGDDTGSTPEETVAGAFEQMFEEAKPREDLIFGGNKAMRKVGKKPALRKEQRLENIRKMVNLALTTNDQNVLLVARGMHRTLKNQHPDIVDWETFVYQGYPVRNSA